MEARAAHAFGSNAWTVDGAARFAYHAERFVDGVSLDVADVAGGADVVVFGGGGGRDAVPLCFFGDVAVDAEATPARWRLPAQRCGGAACPGWTAMKCSAPSHPAGFVVLSFGAAHAARRRSSRTAAPPPRAGAVRFPTRWRAFAPEKP